MRLKVEFTVAAAHFLPRYEGKCKNLHGHNYKIRLHFSGLPHPESGMLIDFHEVERAFAPVFEKIDHRLLNDVIENPTAENLCMWVWEQVAPILKQLTLVEVDEMDGYSVSFSGHG